MDTVNIINEIEQIIQQELNCLQQLDKLMALEHVAIKLSKADDLSQLLEQKNPLIIHLQELDKKRNHVLICNSMTPTLKAFNELIEKSNCEPLQTNWKLLKDKLSHCKNANELNGRLIHMRKNNNESILKILLGKRHVSSGTYSATGRTDIYSKSGLSAVV
jgi:flagellar biosynthesis/type III secretory pathway chaperone